MNKIEQRMIAKILAGGESSEHVGICTNTVLRIKNTVDGWNNDKIDVIVHREIIACYYPYLGKDGNGIIYLYQGLGSSDLVVSRIQALIKGLQFNLDKPDSGVFWEEPV